MRDDVMLTGSKRDLDAFTYEFLDAAADAFERDDFSVIVATVEAVGPDHFGMDMKLPENAFEFERYIRTVKAKQLTIDN